MVEEHDIVGGLFSESSMCSASDDRSIASYIMVDYGAPAKNLGEYRMKNHHTRGINDYHLYLAQALRAVWVTC